MNHVASLSVGAVLAVTIALLARRVGALSNGGAAAAAATGTIAMGADWRWGVVLVAYFVTATLVSRFRSAEKQLRLGDRIEKGGARDAIQVLANGGVFAAAAVTFWIDPRPLWQAVGAGALAASAADTWATEIGVLSRRPARSILSWRTVPAGTSGGVTALGFLAGMAGASVLTMVVAAVGWSVLAAIAAFAGGLLGCVLDSVLGASFQARRWCAACGIPTEQRVHRCGTATTLTGGIPWLDNDGVNALATSGGALAGALVASYL